ncbi:MAG TPA: hypothetical protein DCF62_02635 [Porticoccaceae bacterium]|nr:hypothetical protein [Porticoccaceae bacterium]HCO60780.1 hypothetical protein [Porticoccaceae bacterium]
MRVVYRIIMQWVKPAFVNCRRVSRLSGFFLLWLALLSGAGMHASASEAVAVTGASDEAENFFLLANLEFTLLHEFSHMLIEELKLPVLGMEEDAADRIALVTMLESRRDRTAAEAVPWLFAVAGDWYTEWELKSGANAGAEAPAYWDNHNLEIQRFYHIVCLIFGGNAGLLEDLIDTEILPFDRAMSCEQEYRQARHAVGWVLENYGHSGGASTGHDMIAVNYAQALEGPNQRMYEWLRSSLLAEKLAAKVSARFKLPRPVTVEFENCVSNPDAYWHSQTASVTVCYELLGHFLGVLEYRRQHSQRACGIPILRNLMGKHLRCEETESDSSK